MAENQFPSLQNLETSELIYLYRNQFTIGRGVQCNLVIMNENVSRTHCTLFKDNNGYWCLRDSSTNGTYVNDMLLRGIKSTPLKEGDVIMIGLNEYTYRFSNPATRVSLRGASSADLMTIIASHENVTSSPLEECLNDVPVASFTNAEPLANNVTDSGQPASIITNQNKRPRIDHSEEIETVTLNSTNDDSVIVLDLSSTKNETNEPSTIIKEGVLNKPSTSSDDNVKVTVKENLAPKENLTQKENSPFQNSSFSVIEDEFQCSICSEIFIKAATLGCSHTFCSYCIDQWRKKKTVCPICRANISTVSPTIVLDNFIEKFFIDKASEEQRNLRKQALEERNKYTTVKVKHGVPQQSTSYPVAHLPATIELSSGESDFDEEDEDADYGSFDEPEYEGAYYGGYGRCYSCGRRGHWAPTCPYNRRRL